MLFLNLERLDVGNLPALRAFDDNSGLRSLIVDVPAKSGGLNRSMQHWLAVYSPAFQSPRSFVGVD
jgi:hypothetical protein